MTAIVKTKSNLTVPTAVQRKAGFKPGDVVEFKASGGVITILPRVPSAGDEYTAEQRRTINAQLAEGLEDIRKGRVSPKFDTVDEMLTSLKGRSTRRKKTRAKSR